MYNAMQTEKESRHLWFEVQLTFSSVLPVVIDETLGGFPFVPGTRITVSESGGLNVVGSVTWRYRPYQCTTLLYTTLVYMDMNYGQLSMLWTIVHSYG